jgi:hypothetical protein
MRDTTFGKESEVKEFAVRAMTAFMSDNRKDTFTDDGNIKPGDLFAMRWGLMDRGILVFRIDESFEPVNFVDCISTRPEIPEGYV